MRLGQCNILVRVDAPRVFISYSHDSPEHTNRILLLANRLRGDGVDCIIDQYEDSPETGWPKWCEQEITRAQYVVIVCTETYLRRFNGEEKPRKGLGATWEGHIVTLELYIALGKNSRFIPASFSAEDAQFIPLCLQGATRYELDNSYYSLYRRLTTQPLIVKPELGPITPLLPREVLPPVQRLERKQNFGPLWNVPHRRNVLFTGREKELAEIHAAIQRRGSAALSGLGGLGKTQTAVEYASRHRENYSAIFWAGAGSRAALLAGFASIAATLQLPSAPAQDQEVAATEVKRWLEETPGWLFILDNADDPALVQPFLPQEGKGHLLFTTRTRSVAALAELVRVSYMKSGEGALLLLRRANVIQKEGLLANASDTDRCAAEALSDSLGGLPLAIDQAGAFIEEMRLDVSEYADLYAAGKASLLAKRGMIGDHEPVTVTFSLALEKVAGKSAAAADLIRFCAFLAPDAIPEEIFVGADCTALGENLAAAAENKLRFTEAIGEACRFSLLDRDPANHLLNVHRLVQVVIKAGMSLAEQKVWAERSVRAVERAFPNVEYANWGLCQKLTAQARACASLIDEWSFGFVEAARLLNEVAIYLKERALFTEAESLCRQSLAIYEKALGPDHPHVATGLNNLAGLYTSQGKYAEAEPLHRRSMAMFEYSLGADHPNVATSLNNLAAFFESRGNYAEAEPLYRRSLAIREKALGAEHPDVATSLNNLAGLSWAQGKYAEAEPLCLRSLAIREKTLRPDHPDVAFSLNNLAGLYRVQGKYSEAEPLYRRSLAIREKALGPDHPEVARSLNGLGVLCHDQGKFAEAERLYQRSLAIREKALGPDHPEVNLVRSNLDSLRMAIQGGAE